MLGVCDSRFLMASMGENVGENCQSSGKGNTGTSACSAFLPAQEVPE